MTDSTPQQQPRDPWARPTEPTESTYGSQDRAQYGGQYAGQYRAEHGGRYGGSDTDTVTLTPAAETSFAGGTTAPTVVRSGERGGSGRRGTVALVLATA